MLKTLKENWRNLLIVPFFLTALLTNFLLSNDLSLLSPESIICYLLLVITGLTIGVILIYSGVKLKMVIFAILLIFFILSQFKILPLLPFGLKYAYVMPFFFVFIISLCFLIRHHLSQLLFIFFGVIWVGSFYTPSLKFINHEVFNVKIPNNSKLPPYIQIILDEHIGFEGISYSDAPVQFISSIINQYIDQKFRIYGRAYSRDVRSIASFSSFLNFKPINNVDELIEDNPKEDKHTIKKNALFKTLTKKGYSIHVFQSSYLNLCNPEGENNLSSCTTYRHVARNLNDFSTDHLENTVAILKNVFSILHLKIIFDKFQHSYLWSFFNLPVKDSGNFLSPSTATIKALPALFSFGKNIKSGNAYIIHLLLPHAPYVFNKDCAYVGQEENKTRAYYEQVQCTHKILNKFLDIAKISSFKDSLVIIQGDHGSRIEEPDIRNHYQFTSENIIKNFSTFFMVRNQAIKPGYDLAQLPIDYLLKNILFHKVPPNNYKGEHFVYLRAREQFDLGKSAMPIFLNGEALKDAGLLTGVS